ncbi:Adenine phosphoribosyltransferase [BD1-7 clade bacterium]|uniref:Adenine phosphoribosyltransferase n=1 Tax=BD1-7 clade bacterium TaxID=2029982 RepID=A0A5S9N6R2_9GAMM|nr:Adenine phosphoribosyltransferase [BD1-7 clade bacterium]
MRLNKTNGNLTMSSFDNTIKASIRTVEDWPSPGVRFRDISPVLSDPTIFRQLIGGLVERYQAVTLDAIAVIDARGFLIGSPLAYELGLKLIPVRKAGKLPAHTLSQAYALEYGEAEVEIHSDSIDTGERILVLDDLIATGGTMGAACQLIDRLGGDIVECGTVIDLPELGGSQKLKDNGFAIHAVCSFIGTE